MPSTNVVYTGNSGTSTTHGEGVRPGRVSGGKQPVPGRHPTTARIRWSKETNKLVMKCYLMSQPNEWGYRRRMLDIWDSHGGARVNEQRLADQVRVIIKKGWLTELEIEEIERGIRSQEVVVRGDTNELDETSDRAEGSDRAVDRDRAVGNTVSTVSVEENDTARVELPVGLNDETKTIIQSIRNKMGSESTRPSISLRNLDRNKVRMKARQINEALKYIPTSGITDCL